MFERFTDRARRVIVLSQEEARKLQHNYIGTEHILLGLMAETEGIASRALRELGLSSDEVRDAVLSIIGRGNQDPTGHIPFTPRSKKILELSLREALQLGHNYVGTEHILLGLIEEGEGVAAQVLLRRASLESVRVKIIELLTKYKPSRKDLRKFEVLNLRSAGRILANLSDGAAEVLTRAEDIAYARSGLIRSEDLLSALIELSHVETTTELAEEISALRTRLEELGRIDPEPDAG